MCVRLHAPECLSEPPVQLCLTKVNELDDKIVWTIILELETDVVKKKVNIVT